VLYHDSKLYDRYTHVYTQFNEHWNITAVALSYRLLVTLIILFNIQLIALNGVLLTKACSNDYPISMRRPINT